MRGSERASACGARGRGGDGGGRVGASPPTAAAPSAGEGARGRTVEREAAADAAAAAAVAAVAYLQLFEPLFCRGSSQQPLSAVEAAAVEFSRRTAASGETLHGRSEISKNECEADSESEPQQSVQEALHCPGRVCKSLCCARTRISISFPENCANLSASKLSTKLGSPLENPGRGEELTRRMKGVKRGAPLAEIGAASLLSSPLWGRFGGACGAKKERVRTTTPPSATLHCVA